MVKNVGIKILCQSVSSIITNSSSEVFCRVEADKELLKEMAVFLKGIIGYGVEIYSYEDMGQDFYFQFSMEYGDNGWIQSVFRGMLQHILEEKFGKDNFEIFEEE